MADRRPPDKKPKGSGNPNRINRLLVKKVSEDYSKLTNLVVLTNLAVNSEQIREIRPALRDKNVRMQMVRNRLSMQAFKQLGLKDAEQLFLGPTCIVDAADPVTAAKVAVDLATRFNKSLKLVGGVLEGKILDAKSVEALSKFKTKTELIGDVVILAKSLGTRVVTQFKGPGSRIVGVIKALVEKLEKSEQPGAMLQEASKSA
ncbi:MAG: 50S ribosomal protein L10 [Planctomycetota bacterium]